MAGEVRCYQIVRFLRRNTRTLRLNTVSIPGTDAHSPKLPRIAPRENAWKAWKVAWSVVLWQYAPIAYRLQQIIHLFPAANMTKR